MAISNLLEVSIAIAVALLLVGVRSESSIKSEIVDSESPLRLELDGLRSKISALESTIDERIREIKVKEKSILRLNTVIEERLSSIDYLEKEIEFFQKKGKSDAEKVGKADTRKGELEKQIGKVREEIEAQSRRRNVLDAQVREYEKKAQELDMRLQSLQKTNEDQKLRIKKTQHALELAEEQLVKAQLEATSKVIELTKVYGAWLPHWLFTHVCNIQDFVTTHWNEHAKPALVDILHKASEKLGQVQNWAEPHLDSAKTKARKFSGPYIDQIVTLTKPHLNKLQVVLKPYSKHVVRSYHKGLRRVRTYHLQVQKSILEKLKKHEVTKPHATKELAWFLASALLAFPMFFLYRLVSAVFCTKKARKPSRITKSNLTHRRPKRRHADK